MGRRDDTINITDISKVRHKPPRSGGRPPNRKDGGGFFRSRAWILLRTLFVAAAVLVITYFGYKNIDSLNPENLRRLFANMDTASLEDAEVIEFIGGSADRYEAFRDGLAVVSSAGVSFYNRKGVEELSLKRALTRPAVSTGDRMFAAYDRGGGQLIIANNYQAVFEKEFDSPITNVHMGEDGQFALIQEQEGYRARVAAYNTSQGEIYRFDTASYYCVDAALSRDCGTLAVAAFSEGGTGIESSVLLFDTAKNGIKTEVKLGDCVILALSFMRSDRICAVTDAGCVMLDGEGAELGRVDYGSARLQSFSLGGDAYAALLLCENRVGSRCKIVCIGAEGAVTARSETGEDIECISAAGNRVAALSGDGVLLYDAALQSESVVETGEHIAKIIARADGTVLLLSGNSARICGR